MLSSTKKVINKILTIYSISTLLFLTTIFIIVSKWQEQEAIEKIQQSMREHKRYIIDVIKNHEIYELKNFFNDLDIEIKISHLEEILFSNFKSIDEISPQKRFFFYKDYIYYFNTVTKNEQTINLLIKKNTKKEDILLFKKKLLILLFIIFLLSLVVAYILIKTIIKPLEENAKKLDDFLKDTTHEIKAPLSIMNMSIETMEKENLNEKNLKRLNNLNFSIKTLNNIYESLVEIHFNKSNNEINIIEVDLKLLERISIFNHQLEQKNLLISLKSNKSFIKINEYKLEKIIDNLLSNITKHAKNNSEVIINLEQNRLEISNLISNKLPNNLSILFERYTKINSTNGFGVGLHIIKKICNEFNIKLDCKIIDENRIKFILIWNY